MMDVMAHAALACAALAMAAAAQASALTLPGPEKPCRAEGDFASVLATLLWV